MALYLLERIHDNDKYDIFVSTVVCAPDARAARKEVSNMDHWSKGLWDNPRNSTCKKLNPNGKTGIVISNFKAG